MSVKTPEFILNENLRFIPKDPIALQRYVETLKSNLIEASDPEKRVNLLGEVGVYLRNLDQFDAAEKYLQIFKVSD